MNLEVERKILGVSGHIDGLGSAFLITGFAGATADAFSLFESLLEKIKNDLIKFLFNLNIVVSNEANSKNETKVTPIDNKKIGRNEKCPCGSKKKYKHCCGKY